MSAELKLVVLGTAGVGKSCVIIRYMQNTFADEYDPTIANTYNKDVTTNGRTFHVEILDTAGMETSTTLRDAYTKNRDCYILIYSIDDRTSYDEITAIYNEALRSTKMESVPCVILGNKCDIDSDSREVSTEDGQQLATRLGAKFLETSAKTGEHIEEAFKIAIEKAAEKHPEDETKKHVEKPQERKRCLLL